MSAAIDVVFPLRVRFFRHVSLSSTGSRLLRLPADVRYYIEKEGLTERHARALLKVDDPEVMWTVLRAVTDRHLNLPHRSDDWAHNIGHCVDGSCSADRNHTCAGALRWNGHQALGLQR